MNSKRRKNWIDMMRALAVFFVVLGHFCAKEEPIQMFISPIMMPTFYVVSGMLLEGGKTSLNEFVAKHMLPYWIPNIIFSFFPLYLLRYFFRKEYVDALNYTLDFFTGREWWFLPSFVVSQGIFCLICNLVDSNQIRLAVGAGFFALGIILKDVTAANFWSINAACCGVLFLTLGNIYMQNISAINKLPGFWIGLLTAAYLAIVGMCFQVCEQPKLDFHNVYYCNIVLCVGAMLVGSILLTTVFSRIQYSNHLTRLIAFVGRNTLVVYLLQFILKKYLSKILQPYFAYDSQSLISSAGYAILVCVIGATISVGIRRVFPMAFGKINKRSGQ